jgi:hypothetical protein
VVQWICVCCSCIAFGFVSGRKVTLAALFCFGDCFAVPKARPKTAEAL